MKKSGRRLTPLQRSIQNAVEHEHQLKLENRRNEYAAKKRDEKRKSAKRSAS